MNKTRREIGQYCKQQGIDLQTFVANIRAWEKVNPVARVVLTLPAFHAGIRIVLESEPWEAAILYDKSRGVVDTLDALLSWMLKYKTLEGML